MKLGKWTLIAAIVSGVYMTNASAQQPYAVQPISYNQAAGCDCGEPACGCETPSCEPACGCEDPACGCETLTCEPACGCEDPACGCETLAACDSGCDAGCDSPGGCGGSCCLGDCDLGDPCTLFGEHDNWSVGGWLQLGYHTKANGLFNTRPEELQLQQAWLFAEKTLDTSDGFDFGGRIDYLYGTDGQNTQAFGSDPRGWDNDWDNGGDYGSAMPQLYGEVGYGDLSIKAGHFYTIIGWEVVPATGNFFYSHAYTFNNSEPFTHTGALATYTASEDVTVWGGYSLGWDTGFDDNGDAFLGGASLGLTDDLTLIYAAVGGRFGEARFNGVEKGYMHSIVADLAVTDSLQYIFQSDLLDTTDAAGDPNRQTFGINQYLIKTLSDCWGVGGRFEWWNTEAAGGGDSDVFALTMGVNYRPHANVVIRPEIRWDWDEDQVAGLEDGEEQTTFGIDSIVTF